MTFRDVVTVIEIISIIGNIAVWIYLFCDNRREK